jgi:hypothetical protein
LNAETWRYFREIEKLKEVEMHIKQRGDTEFMKAIYDPITPAYFFGFVADTCIPDHQ